MSATAQEQAVSRALASVLDVVEELCAGLAAGQTPQREWADIVRDTFELHRRDLRDPGSVVWPA